jgi:hypothetical protein
MATRPAANHDGWTLRRAAPRGAPTGARPAAARRGATVAAGDVPAEFLRARGVRVEEVLEATPAEAKARRSTSTDLVLDVDVAPGEASLLVVRHPSGALTFHPSSDRADRRSRRTGAARRGAAAGNAIDRFHVPVRRGLASAGRRGLISKAVEIVVVKIAKAAVDRAVGLAMPKLAAAWEQRAWSRNGLKEGWFRVAPGNGGLRLTPGRPAGESRSLLLVHGTFSNAASAYAGLATTGFFDRIRPLYADRVFAFNHFSVSRTPAENAEQMLGQLPAGQHLFDVVTHSRGGLVLRHLVERAAQERGGNRFRLGHAVLVAVPNDGTPLATPDRWKDTVGWVANLLELFPDNPFTTGAEFVAESIVWLASHLAGDLPGLRAMDGAGDMVGQLQSPPAPPVDAYSALVSNFHPDENVFQRALDVGVDAFFASANDLVVPTEGGWRTDRDGLSHVPAARIGCFGAGGNIRTADGAAVNHLNFFSRPETTEFLVRALSGKPHGLASIDPGAPLPDRRFTRSTRSVQAGEVPEPPAPGTGPRPV